MGKTDIIRYSEAFRSQVVSELEKGRFATCNEAAQFYGIRGTSTVYDWVRKYGKNHLIGKVIRVETINERNELRRAKGRVRDLERAVADMALENKILSNYLAIACEQAGNPDVELFKKKVNGTAPTER